MDNNWVRFDTEDIMTLAAYQYDSPIHILYGDIAHQMGQEVDRQIMKAVAKVDIDVDQEELLRALQYDRDQFRKGFSAGWESRETEMVHCKDCKYWNQDHKYCEGIGNWFGIADEWSENGSCYKGERKEDNEREED